MTAIPQPAVPERIVTPLCAVRNRHWRVAAATGALRALVATLAILLPAALLLGHFGGMPAWLRTAVAALTWAGVVAAAACYLRPALRRQSLTDAAFEVERRTPGLNERLSSAVELAFETGPFHGSPLLLRHLTRQAEADAAAIDPRTIVPGDGLRRAATLLIPLALLWLGLAAFAPRVTLGGLYRAFAPWKTDLPAALARITVTPGDVTVAEGDALEIKATVASSSRGAGATRALLLTRPTGTNAGSQDQPLSRDLRVLGAGQFGVTLDAVREPFTYRVEADDGSSPWYTATVLPRPRVAALDVRYDYPPYTGMEQKTVAGADGSLRALQGTDVTLTVHASEPLDVAVGKSRVAVTEGGRQRTVDLKPVEPGGAANVYEARLTVFNSGSYRIHLVNRHGLGNPDDHPRPIVADLDRPPTVSITAPPPQTTVRPDDDVPVSFNTGDDFGVAAVKAVVQVEDRPPQEHDVRLEGPSGSGRQQVDGQYLLSVPVHLGLAGADNAKTVTYWLKATDNRDPDPQTTESAKQTLKTDPGQSLPYQTRLEQEQARDLVRAIDTSIQRLDQARGPVDSLRHVDAGRALNAGERTRAEEQRDHLAETSRTLDEAAASNLRTAFAAVATEAQAVAQGPIVAAAENVARARLAAEQGEARRLAAAEAVEQIGDARKQLEALKKRIEARAKDVQAARELEKVAERQKQLTAAQQKIQQQARSDDLDARAKQAQEEARQKLRQRQQEIHDRLNRTVWESDALRSPKAQEQAVKLRELLDRLQQIQRDQAALGEQVNKQGQVAAVQERAEALAARQRELNDSIASFAAQRGPALRRADARAPDRRHQAGIVDRLRQNEPSRARDMQRQSAEQLNEAARRLEERGRSNELKPDPVEQNVLIVAEQAKQAAEATAESAKKAGQKLQEAKKASPENATQVAQAQKEAEDAAASIEKSARAAEAAVDSTTDSNDPTAKKNAQDAQQAADSAEAAAGAARLAAQQGKADEAAQKLAEAGQRLVAARQKAAEAAKAAFVAAQQAASKTAAAQARELGDRQAALAAEATQTATALDAAKRDQQAPQDVANRQNQLKDQTHQAKQQADQLERLASSEQSPLAARVAAAEKLLGEAAAAEAEAARLQQAVAQAQQQAQQSLQQAAQADQQAADLRRQSDEHAEEADSHRRQAEAARQNETAARERADAGAEKESQKDQGKQTQRAAEKDKRSRDLKQESAAADQRAAEAVKKADAGDQAAASSRAQAAAKQAEALEALTRAEAALRDVDRTEASARARDTRRATRDPSAAGASPPPPDDAQADARSEVDRSGPARQGAPPPLRADQALQRAAQAAHEAAQAQQQSLNSGADADNALDASQQAAAALQQAAAAMAAATASAPAGMSDSVGAAMEEQAQTTARGAAGAPGDRPGASADPRQGASVAAGGAAADDRPQSVRQLGISAGDWARLGPLTQQDLLNAAQQTGPPSYREMIKNYYVRIARFDQDERRAKAREPADARSK